MHVATAFTLLLVITLFGCDGGGGGLPATFAPAANQALGGVWEGTDSDGIEIVALSTDSGEFHWLTGIGGPGNSSLRVNRLLCRLSHVRCTRPPRSFRLTDVM